MKKGTCASCGARVLWAPTKAGRAMPIDEVPRKAVVLLGGIAHVLDCYTPHWASCPTAAQHRGRPEPETLPLWEDE